MSLALKILLGVDALLLVLLLIYVAVRFAKEKKEPTVEAVDVAPKQEEQVKIVEVIKEVEVVKEVAPVVEEKIEEVAIADVDDLEDDREIVKRVPFSEKMLAIDNKTQSYYNELYNKFISYRKVGARISSKCASFRLGRDLIAKLTVRGKTMKMHLALDVVKFDENVYFQKDLSEVKAYAEVPFTVKVKSDRGLKNALKLIEALAEEKSIESKVRYNAVDAIEELKN